MNKTKSLPPQHLSPVSTISPNLENKGFGFFESSMPAGNSIVPRPKFFTQNLSS